MCVSFIKRKYQIFSVHVLCKGVCVCVHSCVLCFINISISNYICRFYSFISVLFLFLSFCIPYCFCINMPWEERGGGRGGQSAIKINKKIVVDKTSVHNVFKIPVLNLLCRVSRSLSGNVSSLALLSTKETHLYRLVWTPATGERPQEITAGYREHYIIT